MANVNSWDELLKADDTDYATVEVGVGHIVRLGSLSAAEMLQWITDQEDTEKAKTNGLVLVAKCLVDSEGKRYGKLDDVKALQTKQPKTVRKLVKAALALNDLNVKAETKNDSGEAIPSASPTDTASQ